MFLGDPAVALPTVFAGLAPGFEGLYQIDFQIPANAPSGAAVPLYIQTGARASNTVTLAIR